MNDTFLYLKEAHSTDIYKVIGMTSDEFHQLCYYCECLNSGMTSAIPVHEVSDKIGTTYGWAFHELQYLIK